MFKLTVEDVFAIRNRGVVATGRVESGTLRVGDNIGVLLKGIDKGQIDRGAILNASGEFPAL